MEHRERAQSTHPDPERLTAEADAVRLARLRRDAALSPAARLDKLAALCRDAGFRRSAHRVR